MRRRRKRERQYKLIGFKAYTDTDADLLDWWESITTGDRSESIRELLRIALGYYEFAPETETGLAVVSEDIAWMRNALNDLPGYVERVIQHVASNVSIQPDVPLPQNSTPAMNDEAARRREERMKRRQW